jgi:hypothetical protein
MFLTAKLCREVKNLENSWGNSTKKKVDEPIKKRGRKPKLKLGNIKPNSITTFKSPLPVGKF